MVDIHVGQGEAARDFRIHKKLLCSKVPYFDKMFNGGFKEAVQNSVTLPEDNPESFDILQCWVYTGVLRPLETTFNENRTSWTSSWDVGYMYNLSDRLCLLSLRDRVLVEYLDKMEEQKFCPAWASCGRFLTQPHQSPVCASWCYLHCIIFCMGNQETMPIWKSGLFKGFTKYWRRTAKCCWSILSLPDNSLRTSLSRTQGACRDAPSIITTKMSYVLGTLHLLELGRRASFRCENWLCWER